MSYKITPTGSSFAYDIVNIDESIHSVSAIGTKPMDIVLSLSTPGTGLNVSSMTFENLKIQLPMGLVATDSAGEYDRTTGILSIDRLVSAGTVARVTITVTGIDMTANGSVLDYGKHSLYYRGQVEVTSGVLSVTTAGGTLPNTIDFTTSYDFADIYATSFSGEIEYLLSGVDVNDVDLSDIPDFLAGEGTNISLANPQIYLSMNNPVVFPDSRRLRRRPVLFLPLSKEPRIGAARLSGQSAVPCRFCFALRCAFGQRSPDQPRHSSRQPLYSDAESHRLRPWKRHQRSRRLI